jgi:VanZ family protein
LGEFPCPHTTAGLDYLDGPVKNIAMGIIKRLPAVLVAGGIWVLSSQSTLPKPKGILGFDKFQHLLAYFVLSAALGLWFSRESWQTKWRWPLIISLLIASAYGIIDEVHQSFVPGRNANVWDWLADTLGAVLGAFALMFLTHILYKKQRKGLNK